MFAGKLDRRLSLLRPSEGRNDANEVEATWSAFAEVWASRAFARDAEKVQAAQVGPVVTVRFQIRWSPEVAEVEAVTGYRCACEGVTYDVVGVKEIGRREGFEISAAGLPKGAVA